MEKKGKNVFNFILDGLENEYELFALSKPSPLPPFFAK